MKKILCRKFLIISRVHKAEDCLLHAYQIPMRSLFRDTEMFQNANVVRLLIGRS